MLVGTGDVPSYPPPRPMMPLAVVAVGGNALTAADQTGTWTEVAANAEQIGACLAALRGAGWQIAVVHGNGPQVGNLALQQDAGAQVVPAQPLHQLCAMTQGQLGSVLVRAVDRHCGAGSAVAIVTHVEVDPTDPAFSHPTKPIGPFWSAERAAELADERGWTTVEDSGRGYRRVVASPRPTAVVEVSAVRTLLQAGYVVLAAGGGGVAVSADHDGGLAGVDAVIDKDHAAAVLATAIGASELYLLTGVDCVLLDFGTVHQRAAHLLSPEQAQHYLDEGQFPEGSMGPKITAALRFLQDGGSRVIITSAEKLAAATAGEPAVGTCITALHVAAARPLQARRVDVERAS